MTLITGSVGDGTGDHGAFADASISAIPEPWQGGLVLSIGLVAFAIGRSYFRVNVVAKQTGESFPAR